MLKGARKASVFTVASINSEENLVAPAVLRKLPADQRHVILPAHFPDQNIYHQSTTQLTIHKTRTATISVRLQQK